MQATADTLQVPLNRAKFQKFRNMNAVLACVALFMVMLFSAGLAYSLYAILSGSRDLDGWILAAFLCLWLVVFIGSITIATWQLTSIQTQTLAQNLPALIVNQEGIQDNVSNYVIGHIAWSEIESAGSASIYAPDAQKTFVGVAVVLKNKNMLLAKKSKPIVLWMQVDGEIKQKRRVFIPQGRVAMPIEEVVEQINAFRARIKA